MGTSLKAEHNNTKCEQYDWRGDRKYHPHHDCCSDNRIIRCQPGWKMTMLPDGARDEDCDETQFLCTPSALTQCDVCNATFDACQGSANCTAAWGHWLEFWLGEDGLGIA